MKRSIAAVCAGVTLFKSVKPEAFINLKLLQLSCLKPSLKKVSTAAVLVISSFALLKNLFTETLHISSAVMLQLTYSIFFIISLKGLLCFSYKISEDGSAEPLSGKGIFIPCISQSFLKVWAVNKPGCLTGSCCLLSHKFLSGKPHTSLPLL